MGFLAPAMPFIKAGAGLLGGLLGGHKANATQQEDSARLSEGVGDLRNVFNFAMPTGQNLTKTATGTTAGGLDTARTGTNIQTDPLNYYKTILSGNRTANLQQFAPETNALQQQDAAARRQQASLGTARGGGVAGQNEEAKTREMAAIDNGIFAQRPQAAQAVNQIGQGVTSTGLSEAQLGNQQLNEALNYLGLGAKAGSGIADIGVARMNGSPGALSPTGQATIAGRSAAQSGMDLADLIAGQFGKKKNEDQVS
jgi:hypothetical protein